MSGTCSHEQCSSSMRIVASGLRAILLPFMGLLLTGCPEDPLDSLSLLCYCPVDEAWSADATDLEEKALLLINRRRARAQDCGPEGFFPPAPALVMNESLRCAARNHARDMAIRHFFDHINPDGETPQDRLVCARYDAVSSAENIAQGRETAEIVVNDWMNSSMHCRNLMNPRFEEIGVGLYEDGNMWTLEMAIARDESEQTID